MLRASDEDGETVPRIALIHASRSAIAPAEDAFAAHWPEARLFNILDDSLLDDLAAAGRLDGSLFERFAQLTVYASRSGATAVLFTCSAFGAAIERAAQGVDVPVFKPNQAMFEAALEVGPRVVLLATSPPAVASLEEEFKELVRSHRRGVELDVVLVPEAMDVLRGGDAETHNALLAQRAALLPECDGIMLAHFSTARAAAAVRATVSVPVFAAPECAVAALKRQLETPLPGRA